MVPRTEYNTYEVELQHSHYRNKSLRRRRFEQLAIRIFESYYALVGTSENGRNTWEVELVRASVAVVVPLTHTFVSVCRATSPHRCDVARCGQAAGAGASEQR